MKVKMVEIRPLSNNEWAVSFCDLFGDRQLDKHPMPNALGFYYYPADLLPQQAFDDLKGHMIVRHEEKIWELQESLKKLKALQMNTKR